MVHTLSDPGASRARVGLEFLLGVRRGGSLFLGGRDSGRDCLLHHLRTDAHGEIEIFAGEEVEVRLDEIDVTPPEDVLGDGVPEETVQAVGFVEGGLRPEDGLLGAPVRPERPTGLYPEEEHALGLDAAHEGAGQQWRGLVVAPA